MKDWTFIIIYEKLYLCAVAQNMIKFICITYINLLYTIEVLSVTCML